jgi:hypothetical protein
MLFSLHAQSALLDIALDVLLDAAPAANSEVVPLYGLQDCILFCISRSLKEIERASTQHDVSYCAHTLICMSYTSACT